MSNLKNLLKMLNKLNTGKVIKKEDLANELNISKRQVARYKEELSEFLSIETLSGPNGGYRMISKEFPLKELLNEKEIIILKTAINQIKDDLVIDSQELNNIIDKINYSLKSEKIKYSKTISYSKIKFNDEKLSKMIEGIYINILESKKIIINYKGNNEIETRREINPYEVITYKKEPYLIAYCNLRNEIRMFKLIRISEYILTDRIFKQEIDIEIVLSEFKEKNLGIFLGEEIEILLEIKPPMSNTIKERIWVDNQEIIELEDGKILFNAVVKNNPEIKSWILTMQDNVKIIKPQILKKEIKEILNKMILNI